jgi:hypothetical protein
MIILLDGCPLCARDAHETILAVDLLRPSPGCRFFGRGNNIIHLTPLWRIQA